MLIRGAEVGGQIVDVRCTDGRVTEIGQGQTPRAGEEILEAHGGALLPGLHDHHIHLHALAAALASVRCGPPEVEDREALAQALAAPPDARGWLRGTGYFESVAGPLDRFVLDRFRDDIPVRVQHRSGAMWFLNSRALEALGVEDRTGTGRTHGEEEVATIERDGRGRATGRLFRADGWLRQRLPSAAAPDLGLVGRRLAGYGVTTITDATATNGADERARFRAAQASGALPQRLLMMGALEAGGPTEEGDSMLRVDAHKIMLDEPALPNLDRLVETLRRSHEAGRPVAIHTVTRAEIHFALAALESAGSLDGDRLEHASIAPCEAIEMVKQLGLTIVTQPNFVAERGDAYQVNVDERDRPHLYRVKSWLDAGVRLGGGTDAPFGHPDPWRAMRAAVERRTPTGNTLGKAECVSPETAFALFLPEFSRAPQRTGEAPPAVGLGSPADLCLLERPWRQARLNLSSEYVSATLRGGALIYKAQEP